MRISENIEDKVVGITFRCREQLESDVVWGVLGKFLQSKARFDLRDRHEVHFDHVRLPAGNSRTTEITKERCLVVPSAIRKSIVTVKTAFLCLAHALFITMTKVNGYLNYALYSVGKVLNQPVQEFLSASGVKLTNGRGFNGTEQFQNIRSDYKIIVYDDLSPDRVIFSENSISTKEFTFCMVLDTSMSL
jgi:hypothetical protein